MAWQYAAQAGLAMFSAGMQAKEQLRAEGAHNALMAAQRQIAGNRETEATLFNIRGIKQQEVSDLMNIDKASLRAEDAALVAKANSGLTGASLDDIDGEILIDVNNDKVSAQRMAAQNLDEQTKSLRYSNENRVTEAINTKINTKPKAMIRNALLSSAGGSLTSAAAKMGNR